MNKFFVIAALAALSVTGQPSAQAADLDIRDYTSRPDPRITREYAAERRHGDWRGDWREHRPYRSIIEARGSYAGDFVPYHIAEWRARRSAIEAWKMKAEDFFGPRFANWRDASDKSIDCDRIGRGTVECSVSARPERTEDGRRWGSWNWRRTNY